MKTTIWILALAATFLAGCANRDRMYDRDDPSPPSRPADSYLEYYNGEKHGDHGVASDGY